MIIIEKDGFDYEIPEPGVLYKNMNTMNTTFVTIRSLEDPSTALSKDHRLFFIENAWFFQEYLNHIMKYSMIPDNFYMYVNSILQCIKVKNLQNDVDPYWKKMLN